MLSSLVELSHLLQAKKHIVVSYSCWSVFGSVSALATGEETHCCNLFMLVSVWLTVCTCYMQRNTLLYLIHVGHLLAHCLHLLQAKKHVPYSCWSPSGPLSALATGEETLCCTLFMLVTFWPTVSLVKYART